MKIICIGLNYGNAPISPIFFLKPDTALLHRNRAFYLPSFSREVCYECEVVVRIDRTGKCIEERFAPRYYSEVGLGIDFTARDLLTEARHKGLPWEPAKSFDHSAVLSPKFLPLEQIGGVQNLDFELRVGGQVRQRANTREMCFTVNYLIAYISHFMTLKTGDLIYTGTPAGVGPVRAGDRLQASLAGHELLNFPIR